MGKNTTVAVPKKKVNWKIYLKRYWQLYAYDRQPLFIEFQSEAQHESGWAIYNRLRGAFVFADDVVKESTMQRLNARYHTTDLTRLNDALQQRKSLDYEKLMKTSPVYIQMITTDRYIRGLYDGWYHHNENHTALINEEGLCLPYTGLKKAFYAYAYRFKSENPTLEDTDEDIIEPLDFPTR